MKSPAAFVAAYVVIGALIYGDVYNNTQACKHLEISRSVSEDCRNGRAIMFGVFWPVALPLSGLVRVALWITK